ncbi:MAG: hypothetical protein C4575_04260 [Desulforudis sp.]|nr:hypothetical protein [Clostridia bacterium]RJX21417.1 MAG: hypothetical protein C4575_04260 [Desulforudis sp.]
MSNRQVKEKCPYCKTGRIIKVGQFDKFMYWGFGGTLVMALGGFFVMPGFYTIMPLWWFFCLFVYLSRPLYTCEECNTTWDPRKEDGPVKAVAQTK